ncbi:Piwi-domain-containing protein [Daldinia caldariorum]|uniref:Piwi-domain-containing protein n=1 Tax=Daldinia caldariorum TaxID=326644 RepID=UPI0020073903|nr:Piwi-domain-containing protein [Daldinia caldariorum]KAI1464868.1 Piwi-domain-containing protein [Daldinia caldariorum]
MSRHSQHQTANQSQWPKATRDTKFENDEDSIVKDLNAKKQCQKFPSRPHYGKGASVTLWTNYVAMSVGDLELYRYNIAISPECNRRRNIQVIKLFLQSLSTVQDARGIITDFRSILLSLNKIELPGDSCEIVYRAEDEAQPRMGAKQYTVTLKFEKVLSVSDLTEYANSTDISTIDDIKMDIVQALNILFNHYSEITDSLATSGSKKLFPIGNSRDRRDLGGGLEVIMGYFTSVRWITSRFLLNVNVCRATFYKPIKLNDLIREYREKVALSDLRLAFFLNGLRVQVDHLNRTSKDRHAASRIRTIRGLATTRDGQNLEHRPIVGRLGADSKEVRFWMESKGAYMSVYDYFRERYNISPIQGPVINVGTSENPTYLVPDVCTVLPGKVARTKLTPDQSQSMIDFCTGGPLRDTTNIQGTGLTSVGLRGRNPTLGRFNIRFPQEHALPSLITVPARILQAASVFYRNGSTRLNEHNRSWNLRNVQFTTTFAMGRWSYVVMGDSQGQNQFKGSRERNDLENMFKSAAMGVGIRYTEPVELGADSTITIQDVKDIPRIFHAPVANKLNWLLVVLPKKAPAPFYNSIKRIGDLHAGITTICIDGGKLRKTKFPDQYLANVCMKLNLKLGGNNQRVRFQDFSSLNFNETMIVGIDVTHPSPSSDKNAPSIAAVVATIDSSMGQWPAVIRRQTQARQEMVSRLADMLRSRLELWKKTSKVYPRNIIVYRDGVSEGQYNTVVDNELPLLKEACNSIPAYKQRPPLLTVIIVAKRHHTRFYASGAAPSNPGPGTVVDRGVTEARHWDFYLQPHHAIKGTARPIHYFVVHDEIFGKMRNAAGELEGLTQGLCYMFGRATMPVSVCTPAYYADIACERARCYLDRLFDNPGEWEGEVHDQRDTPSDSGIRLHANIRDTMFYI